jgi:hypothetical protein
MATRNTKTSSWWKFVTDTFDRAWWRMYAATLAERFRQESIHRVAGFASGTVLRRDDRL